jgi:hypothetical protein
MQIQLGTGRSSWPLRISRNLSEDVVTHDTVGRIHADWILGSLPVFIDIHVVESLCVESVRIKGFPIKPLVPIEINILLLANAHSICGVVVIPALQRSLTPSSQDTLIFAMLQIHSL